MKTATATLQSISPYSQSRYHGAPKLEKESADDYERRTWRMKAHATDDGRIFIPPMAFKNSLAEAAAYLGEKIPGRRNATWTKHFLAGILVVEGPVLDVKVDECRGDWIYCNADGKKNSGTRVMRCFPVVPEWRADVAYHVLDDTITEAAFLKHLKEAGNFIGIGRFRPRSGGFLGRYRVESVRWGAAAND